MNPLWIIAVFGLGCVAYAGLCVLQIKREKKILELASERPHKFYTTHSNADWANYNTCVSCEQTREAPIHKE